MTAILPAHSTDIVVSYDYPVSETVIVGEIPDMYLDKGKADFFAVYRKSCISPAIMV